MTVSETLNNAGLLTTRGGLSCPVCRSPTVRAMSLQSYNLFACSACGCWSSDALAQGAATSFEPESYFANPRADQPRWEHLLARREQAGYPVQRVLDVGCGSGEFLKWISQKIGGLGIEGIEIDAARAAQARNENAAATIHTGDAAAKAAELTGQFDLITLWDVFEHVTDPLELLTTLASRLSPNGWLLLQTIHENSLLPALGRLSYRLTGGHMTQLARRTHEAHHLVFFSRQGLAQLFSDIGLSQREEWFGRLSRDRMDGNPIVTATAAALMSIENAFGNGLFVNCIVERADADV